MNCKSCPYRKLCHDLVLEGFIDLSCKDVKKIAEMDVKEDAANTL